MSREETRRQYFLRLGFGIVLLLILAVPALVHSAAAIGTLRNVPVAWLPDSSPIKADFARFVRQFGLTDVIMISWPTCTLDDPSIGQAMALLQPLSVSGPSDHDEQIPPDWAEDLYRSTRELCGTDTPIDWVRSGTQLRDSLVARPVRLSESVATKRLQGTVIGHDGNQTCLVMSLGISTSDHHRTLLPQLRKAIARTVDVQVNEVCLVGGAMDGAAVDEESIRSIERYSPFSSLIAAVLCWICLRSIPLSVAIVAVATVGQGMVLAMVYYTGENMNAVLIVLPALVFVLTVSSGIHLSNYYLEQVSADASLDSTEAAKTAMQMGTLPCMLATGTTVIGLSSLLLVGLMPVRIFGLVASFGVVLTLGLLLLTLPGAMLLTKKRAESIPDHDEQAEQTRWARLLSRPLLTMSAFFVVTVVAAVGLARLTTSVSVPRMFGPESDLRRQYDWFESNVGATMTGDVLVSFPTETNEGNALDQLQIIKAVHLAIKNVDGVGGVLSGATFLPSVPKSRGLSATAKRNAIRSLIDKPDSSFNQLGYVAHEPGERTWRLTLRFFQTDDTDFASRIDAVNTAVTGAIAKASTDSPKLAMTGHVVVVQRTQQLLLRDLFKSFVAAFGVILIVMTISLRSFFGGLLSMCPNIIPTLVLFGFMGWIGLPLDIGSVMTASVALGIAIDDTVHLLSRYRDHRMKTDDSTRAAAGALNQCGLAMFQTTLVCSGSLMVYALSEFVPTRRFAIFMFGLLSIAFLGVTVVLPGIMASPAGRAFAKK